MKGPRRTPRVADFRHGRPGEWRGRLVATTTVVVLTVGMSGGAIGSAAAQSASSSSPALPSAATLQAALLTADDLGAAFSTPTDTDSTDSGSTSVTGCPALEPLLAGTPGAGQEQQQTSLQAGDQGPFIDEALLAESSTALASGYARDRAAIESCKTLDMTSGGTELDFTLSPIKFAPANSAAVRLDGTYDGVETNGYLAVADIGNVELDYFYLQLDSGSSQLASYFFTEAVSKAQSTLSGGGTAPAPGASPTAPPPPASPVPNQGGIGA